MKRGSLFKGYGGLDEAVEQVLGGTEVWCSEINPDASAVLSNRWPDVPNLGDITEVDWSAVEPVDVLTAGWPCQDISNAGKRAGIEGAHSGLWRNVADAIGVLRPGLVVLENVSAVVVRGLDRVLADLAALGFDAEWTCVRASDVGAPHPRKRFFLVAADAESIGLQRTWSARHWRDGSAHGGATSADADRGRRGTYERHDGARQSDVDWGGYEPAIRRWERILGRTAPAPTVAGRRGARQLNPVFVEWMQGLDEGHVTAVPGLSRNAMLRILGNGVVPAQAAAALRYLLPLLLSVEAVAA